MLDEAWTEAGRILGLMVLGVFLLYADRLRERVWLWVKNRRLNPVARAVMTCRAIVDLLVELRVKLVASRAYVMQFHNGQTFTSQRPLYRMSCTQEAVAAGLVPIQPGAQNILVEQVWQEIEPLFGVAQLPGVSCLHREARPATPPFRATYYYVVEQIPEGWFKSDLILRGAWAVAISPLIDHHGTLVGFVAVEFTDAPFRSGEAHPVDLIQVTHAAANIWYALERHAAQR